MIKKLLFLCLFITTYVVVAQGDESEIIHQKIESFFKDFIKEIVFNSKPILIKLLNYNQL